LKIHKLCIKHGLKPPKKDKKLKTLGLLGATGGKLQGKKGWVCE
jgi:hypothetical protein